MLQASTNIVSNTIPLGLKLYDLYDIAFNTQEQCLTDQEYIDTVGDMMDDFGSMISTVMGFDLDWHKADVYQAYSFDSNIKTISKDPLSPKDFVKKYLRD